MPMVSAVSDGLCSQASCLIGAGLGSRVLTPADREYDTCQKSYWSASAVLRPACIFRPRSSLEVSSGLRAIIASHHEFAIRSGGHTNWAGSNNIEGGITIDLSLMNDTVYDKVTEIATIGPGARWRDVYAELDKYGRAVAGGREGNVGVGGLLLGGGNTFFTAQRGFACDNVVWYEVVLADGTIVVADDQKNTDLFNALKGGSNNFGIVTNFKMATIRCDRIWGGIAFSSRERIPAAIDSLSSFTDNIPNNVDSNLFFIFTYTPEIKDVTIATIYAQVGGIAQASAYEESLAIPYTRHTVKMTSLSEWAAEYNEPAGYYTTWFTLSFRNDTRIMAKASELHDQLVEELKLHVLDGDFITQCVFQPLPRLYAQHSVAAGGNVMGIEHHAHDGILFLAAVMVRTSELEALAYDKVKEWTRSVQEYATTVDGNLDWIYLNYADKSQDPLGSYGTENVARMRRTAAKYDPQQAFQKLCKGGFKISHVV